jgi:hypothetical protein
MIMAVVCVWAPHSARGGLDVGHSALLLDRIHPPAYISWWPDGGVDKAHPKTKGHFTPPYRQDVLAEHGNPTRIISLKCLQETTIAHWWHQVKIHGAAIPLAPKFQLVSSDYDLWYNNCSTIVLTAMKVGGSESLLPFDASVITPEHIWYYAWRLSQAGG